MLLSKWLFRNCPRATGPFQCRMAAGCRPHLPLVNPNEAFVFRPQLATGWWFTSPPGKIISYEGQGWKKLQESSVFFAQKV